MVEAASDVDPVALTIQCRYLEHWLDIGSNEEQLVPDRLDQHGARSAR